MGHATRARWALVSGFLALGALVTLPSCRLQGGQRGPSGTEGRTPLPPPGPAGGNPGAGNAPHSPSGWRQQVAASLLGGLSAAEVAPLGDLTCGDILAQGGYLFIAGISGAGDASLMERLCYRRGDLSFMVDAPDGLRGYVTIRSPKAALQYVRIYTSPMTAKCLREPWWVEVIPQRELDDGVLLGSRRRVFWLGGVDAQSGSFGVLSDHDWGRSGLRAPAVRREGDRFVVTRFLVVVTARRNRTHRVYEVAETVSVTGCLERRVLRRARYVGPTLEVPVELM